VRGGTDSIVCPLCGARDLAPAFTKKGRRFYECPRCRHVRVAPYPSREETEAHHRSGFCADYLAHNREWFQVLAKKRMETLRRHFPDNFRGSVLDAGSGYGLFLREARDQGWNAVGVETSPVEIEHSVQNLSLEVIDRDLLEAFQSLPDSSFDAITFWHTLEHLEEPGRVIDQAIRLLTSDGILVLNSPNLDSAVFKILGRRWSWIYVPGHLQYFRVKPFSDWLATKGLRVRSVETGADAPNLYFMIEEAALLTLSDALLRLPLVWPGGRRLRKIAFSRFHQQWIQLRVFRKLYDLTPGLDRVLRSRLLGHEFLLVLSRPA
jgi:SAM-dependent methyltransferase